MGVVLSILSVLGKVILWLLGILFVLLLCILFYPIKYQLEAEFQQNVRMQGRIQWLWFFLRLHFSYQETFQWKLRLFGLDVMKLLEGDGGTKQNKHQKKKETKEKKREADKQAAQREHIAERNGRQDSDDAAGVQDNSTERTSVDVHVPDRIKGNEPDIGETIESSDVPSRQNFFQKIIQFVKKWCSKLSGFISGAKRLCRRLRKKAEFAREMLSLFRSDNSKALVCIMKDNVVHLWRKLKPKVFRGHLVFGTGDPASTGEILGLFAILYAWYGDNIQIVPDFEGKVFEGKVFMRGKISVFTILLVLIRVFLSDEWKQFRQEYDRISASC